MRKIMIAVSSLAMVAGATAQEALQCVDPDVLNALVFNARAEARVTVQRALPEVVDGFTAPEGFTLIGSGVRGENAGTVVGYKTDIAAGEAFGNLVQHMVAQGWRRESPQGAQQPTIMVAGPQPLAAQLCRNGDRRAVVVRDIEGIRYATINAYPTIPARACDAPVQRSGGFGNPITMINEMRTNMPQLTFPETTRTVGGANPGMNADSSTMVSSAVRIQSPDAAGVLAEHITGQLTAQNWSNDAKWNGSLSTGSTWTRRGGDGNAYWGMLEILTRGEGVYDVQFSVSAAPR